jgi:hypothetical protein
LRVDEEEPRDQESALCVELYRDDRRCAETEAGVAAGPAALDKSAGGVELRDAEDGDGLVPSPWRARSLSLVVSW